MKILILLIFAYSAGCTGLMGLPSEDIIHAMARCEEKGMSYTLKYNLAYQIKRVECRED